MAHIVFNYQLVSYIIFVISMCLCVYVVQNNFSEWTQSSKIKIQSWQLAK
jgi:hypothetical protein